MFWNIAEFFIKNSKISLVIVIITIFLWIWSYLIIPKQYNPSIIVPAFNIMIPANWLSAKEVSKYVISPLENKIMELKWIDEVYWTAWDNYWNLMLKFKVWEDLDKAKIKLIQKVNENIWLKPNLVWNPIITSIDPETLSQITYAITYIWEDLSKEEKYIYLRSIANIIKENIKTVKNLTTIEIVWWYKNNIIVDLDLDKLQNLNLSLSHIYNTLKNNTLKLSNWNISTKSGNKIAIEVDWKSNIINDLKKTILQNNDKWIIYLEDIAKIKKWVKKIDKLSFYNKKEAVFIWFWKIQWTNSVFLTKNISKKIEEIKETLPKNIQLNTIQNEWKTAENATNMLLINLLQSIIIVFIILAIYLWKKWAFNTAISIPLTLSLVFFLALLLWENINRITLFALILVLWMLVDNSTVVVENISRHLDNRALTWKTKLQAVKEWVQEVWTWTILSTIARLLAFWAMFAVWWMMWEYMWPIPKFVIIALLISLLIAFTINPWISYITAKDIETKDNKNKKQDNKYDIRKYYLNFMKKYLNNSKKSNRNRKVFKIIFWLSLIVIILWPIYWWIFKARMLPKSNADQIYLWIDTPRWWNSDKIESIKKDSLNFFEKQKVPKELKIIKNISITSGQAFIWDFANLFRWWLSRTWENQISMRINLISPNKYKKLTWNNRIFSEKYTYKIRPLFRKYILNKYPDIKVRLLEDPPGPPVRATFLAIIKSNASNENKLYFMKKVENEVKKIWKSEQIVDIWNSLSTTYRKVTIKLNKEAIIKAWLTSLQIINTINIATNNINITSIENNNSLEQTNLILGVKNNQRDSIELLNKIFFINNSWEKIFLDSIANIKYTFVWDIINTDKREKSDYIYWEMWDNSLIYPIIKLFWILKSNAFLNWEYKVSSWSPYKIDYLWLKDWKRYTIEWSWEWSLTMDTFRDLWLAMWFSLLAIYFLLVWQFANFRVAGIIMITFLLSFYWIFWGFSLLYLFKNEYFSATSMIWIIALWWIVVGNAIILIDYINILKKKWLKIEDALLKAGYMRFAPIILTSLTTIFWAMTIIWDPVWSGLAWSIIWWLLVSSILTLVAIPIFYYDSQKNNWN